MTRWKKPAGALLGIAVCLLMWHLPLQGLPADGRRCLAMTLCVILWWSFEVTSIGYSSAALLIGYTVVLDHAVAPPTAVFRLWSLPMAYLIIGGFLIGAAVRQSGIGQRFALFFLGRFVRSYRHIIISCYIISFLLAFIIPQSFARAFLMMTVMQSVIKESGIERRWAANVGLAVFASQISAGMFLLTAESSLNFTMLSQLPENARLGWLGWLAAMGLPAVLLGCSMCILQLKLFGGPAEFVFSPRRVRARLAEMGRMTPNEKKTIFWLLAAVTLWMTDTLHGIDLGWISLGIAVLMSLPVVGGVLDSGSWREINMGTMLFLTACVAIGSVGAATGMNGYLSGLLVPANLQGGVVVFAALVLLVCLALHLVLGSILALFALTLPALLALARPMGISGTVVGLLVYTALACQWLFPYQNLNISIGLGEAGLYTTRDSLRFGLACTPLVALCMLIELGWWKLIGLY